MSYRIVISNKAPIKLSRFRSALLHLVNELLTLFNLKTRHLGYCEGIPLTPICVEIDRMNSFHCSLTLSAFLREKLQNFKTSKCLRVTDVFKSSFRPKDDKKPVTVAVCITFLSLNLSKQNVRQIFFIALKR